MWRRHDAVRVGSKKKGKLMGIVSARPEETGKIVTMLGWADKDYLSARPLLLASLLVQGTVLSNTAIEKYLKTICLMAAATFPRACHDVPVLYGILMSRGIDLGLNPQYLELLRKAYELRYPDNLEAGYNICLSQAKLIAELDSTVFKIRKGFQFRRSDGKPVASYLDQLLEVRDKNLLDLNSSFGATARNDIFTQKNSCYELRVLENGSIIEAQYQTTGVKDDGVFDLVALRPGK
jgi:uncharacterized protein YxjI